MPNTPAPGATLADWLATSISDDFEQAEGPALPRLKLSESEAPDVDLLLGDLLGVGGMAVVVRAEQRSLGREVAVKRAKQPASPSAIRGLLREAWVTGQLDHPNVVPVHLVGETDEGEPVVVLRSIGGQSWLQRLADDPADDPEALNRHLAVFVAVCNAAHYAHERGFLHRDIKPANVQIGDFGEVYVLDWGIAAAMDVPVLNRAGTPAYMAPEMLDKCAPDRRSDVFLLGATLLEVVTGAAPRDGTGTSEMLAGARDAGIVIAGEIPIGLRAVIERACAQAVEDRYPDAAALRDAVLAWEVDQGVASLLEAAQQRLRGFEDAATATELDPGDDAAAAVAREQFAAARFGFEVVLADRPEHAGARDGLGRCLERMIRVELAHGAATNARVLLAAHPQPSQDILDLVDRKASELEAANAEQARLARVARAYDTTDVARDWLVLLSACTIGIILGIGSTNLWIDPDVSADPMYRMAFLLGPSCVAFIAVVSWKRASLVHHPVGQRLTLAALGLIVAVLVSRTSQIAAGIPYRLLAVGEPFLMSAWILGNSTYLRQLWYVGALGLVGAAANASLIGQPAQLWFQNLVSISLAVGFSLVWWRALSRNDIGQ